MKFTHLLAALAMVLIFVTVGLAADKTDSKAAQPAAKELKPQTLCPVMGNKIDSAAYTDIQGQRIYHCCPMCAAKLKADPEKYFRQAAAEGVLFENIQKACPVTGKAFDKKIYTDYVGRRIYFATKDAKAQFAKNPAKYLAVLDEQVGNKATETKTESHSEQSGHTMGMAGGSGH